MTKTDVVTKVKKWIENEYSNGKKFISSDSPLAHKYGKEIVHDAFSRSFGILMFALNELLDYDSEEALTIRKWWDDEMLPRFRKLERR